ncbi:primosomal protein N' [Rarobacter incanus]
MDALVVERGDTTDFEGELQPIRRVISPVCVAPPATLELCRRVADYYAATVADVFAVAIPPRHARAEASVLATGVARDSGAANDPGVNERDSAWDGGRADAPRASGALVDGGSANGWRASGALADAPRPSCARADVPWPSGALVDGGSASAGRADAPRAAAVPVGSPRVPGSAQPSSAGAAFHAVWGDYPGGSAFLNRIAGRQGVRAVWQVLPHAQHPWPAWVRGIVSAVQTVTDVGRGAVVVVPDDRDVTLLCAALAEIGLSEWTPASPGGSYVRLQASQGIAARYGAYVATATGRVRVVVGTRSAAFAPVADLGLIAVWDDADSSHRAERFPRTTTLEVVRIRAEIEHCAVLLASDAVSLRAHQLTDDAWAHLLTAPRQLVRHRAPRVNAIDDLERERGGGEGHTRMPPQVWRTIRDGLRSGPVLVQVPRGGYIVALACATCRASARCKKCEGPLQMTAGTAQNQRFDAANAQCAWCGALGGSWRCAECGDTHLRSVRIGSQRTADELGRAFPHTAVRVSGLASSTGVIDAVSARPELVVATPGAEPRAAGGYAAAALLDADAMAAGAHLDTEVRAFARWIRAASLVRSADEGGIVSIVAGGAVTAVQALVRWDPAGYAARELADRRQAHLPPAVRFAALYGPSFEVADAVSHLRGIPHATILGPAPWEDGGASSQAPTLEPSVRALVCVPHQQGAELAHLMRTQRALASANRRLGQTRIELDPQDL